MLHEFAVDPGCMPDINSLRRIVDQCALHLGRFISAFPQKQWIIKVHTALRPPDFRGCQQLQELLQALERRGGLIDTGRTYQGQTEWIDNAIREHSRLPFAAIVSHAKPMTCDYVLKLDDLSTESGPWGVQTEQPVARTSDALTGCVRRLIHLSRDLLFVDPHFSPDTARYQEALQAFLSVAHEGGRSYRRLEYHTIVRVDDRATDAQRTAWIERFRKDCLEHLPRRIPRDVTMSIVLWDERTGGDEMHARYVMTERGAIRIDKGLDLGEPTHLTDVSIVAPNVYQLRWNNLLPGATAYDLIDTVLIKGTGRS